MNDTKIGVSDDFVPFKLHLLKKNSKDNFEDKSKIN
jgi:hypothetical protein